MVIAEGAPAGDHDENQRGRSAEPLATSALEEQRGWLGGTAEWRQSVRRNPSTDLRKVIRMEDLTSARMPFQTRVFPGV